MVLNSLSLANLALLFIAHYSHVIADTKAVEEQNRRVASSATTQFGKYDYHERLREEREGQEKKVRISP